MKQRPCTCPVRDWRAFRYALGVTQGELGAALGLSGRTIQALEEAPKHRCVPEASRMLLRLYLQRPAIQAKCRLAGVEFDAAPYQSPLLRAS